MNEFWTQFFNQYGLNQQVLSVLIAENKAINVMFFLCVFVPSLAILIDTMIYLLDGERREKKATKARCYILLIAVLSSLVVGAFAFGSGCTYLEKYPSDVAHYIEVDKNSIIDSSSYKRLSEIDKSAVLMAFEFSKERLKTQLGDPLISIHDKEIYDFNKLKELSVMNSESLIGFIELKNEQAKSVKKLRLEGLDDIERLSRSLDLWVFQKINLIFSL